MFYQNDNDNSPNRFIEILRQQNSCLRQIIEEKNSIISDLKSEIDKLYECQKKMENKMADEFQQTKQENEILHDAVLALEEKNLNRFLVEIRTDTENLFSEKFRILENLNVFKREIESNVVSPNDQTILFGENCELKSNDSVLETTDDESVDSKVINKIDDLLVKNQKLINENDDLKRKIVSLERKSTAEINGLVEKLNNLTAEMNKKNSYVENLEAKFMACTEEFKEFQMKLEYRKLNENRLAVRLNVELNNVEDLRHKMCKFEIQSDLDREKIARLETDLKDAALKYCETKDRELFLQQTVLQLQSEKEKALNEQLETECRRKKEISDYKVHVKHLRSKLAEKDDFSHANQSHDPKKCPMEKKFKEVQDKCYRQQSDIEILHQELDKKESDLRMLQNRQKGFFQPKRKRPNNFHI